jgi:hypothetical protein
MSSGMRSRMSSTMSSILALGALSAPSGGGVNRYGFLFDDGGGSSTGRSVSKRWSAIHFSASCLVANLPM